MKTPFGSPVQGTETPPSPSAAKRPSALGEGKSYSLGPTRYLRGCSPSYRSSPGTATPRLQMCTDWEKLSWGLNVLLMPLTATARHQQKVFKPFGYSIKAAGARRSVLSPVITCIAGSPAITTPPSTKRASLQATVPRTSDLVAIEIA